MMELSLMDYVQYLIAYGDNFSFFRLMLNRSVMDAVFWKHLVALATNYCPGLLNNSL